MRRKKENKKRCGAHRVSPGAKGWVVKTPTDGVQEGVEGAIVLDLLDRYGVNLLLGQECELDSVDRGRDRLRDIHGCMPVEPGLGKKIRGVVVGRRLYDARNVEGGPQLQADTSG